MGEEADEPNTLLIAHLWKAATERDGPYVHKGIGTGLGCVAYTLQGQCSHLKQTCVCR